MEVTLWADHLFVSKESFKHLKQGTVLTRVMVPQLADDEVITDALG